MSVPQNQLATYNTTAPGATVRALLPRLLFGITLAFGSASGAGFPETGPTTPAAQAALHSGIASAPVRAPLAVKRAIWAGNQLRSKPYRFGGGHRSFADSGYDCSGTISYALGAAGLLISPISSSDFRRYGAQGQGRWITIYARHGHTFAVIAGLRLDTTPFDNSTLRWAPRWQTNYRWPRGFVARHPTGL